MARETMEYDLLIIGAGPAGLTAALRAKRQALAKGRDLSIAVIDKAPTPGAHTLSGAILNPRTLNEFWPDWRQHNPPLQGQVLDESLIFLSKHRGFRMPSWSVPKLLDHHGQDLISLGQLVAWLAEKAEAENIDVLPGFSAVTPIFADDQPNTPLLGVVTGDFGVAQNGARKPNYQPGIELRARYTLIAEGTRGSLTRQIMKRFNLARQRCPQKYALGFRELWRIPETQHTPGRILHFMGWPLMGRAAGGGFLYFLEKPMVAVGLIAHLNYENPFFSPFDEFQCLKTHPEIRALLEGGERLSYGARTISEGGVQFLPKLIFPGGALLGCAAGIVNSLKTQGIHTSMKSGMLAADAAVDAIIQNRHHDLLTAYENNFRASWAYRELYDSRNCKPLMGTGKWHHILATGIGAWAQQLGVTRWLPITLKQKYPDHQMMRPQAEVEAIEYPPYDEVFSFDRSSSLFLSNLFYTENQPSHLHLSDPGMPEHLNLPRYGGPETRYCPAGVYEYVYADNNNDTAFTLRIHAENCLQCKACDIKDPTLNIVWTPPEGGNGPRYVNM